MTDDSPTFGTYLLTDDDGSPVAAIDLDMVSANSTRLAYALCAVSGDDAAINRVAAEWVQRLDTAYGYTAAAALTATVRMVVEPLLMVLDRALPQHDFRGQLAESSAYAEKTLGGDR